MGAGARPGTGRHRGFRFGEFMLDLDRGALLRDGTPVKLRPKSFAVLRFLVERQGRLVSKQAILEAVWRHSYVSDGTLAQCLIDVRRALGDEEHALVKTVPRRGYIFEPAVEEVAAQATPASSRIRRPWLVAALGAALAVVLALAAVVLGGPSLPWSTPELRENSIAVLPFADMTPARDQAYFADGMAEEILNMLTRVPGLRVTARTSSFAFRDQDVDIPTVASKLNVSHVLEGSVRRSGDEVRITVQLIDADDNLHVWSNTYHRRLGDVLVVQEEIARSVAESLRVSLEADSLRGRATATDPGAYEDFLRGQYFWNRRAPGDSELARQAFQSAVSADPGMAPAWVALAGVYNSLLWERAIDTDTGLALYKAAIDRALGLAPDSARAHARASGYYILVGEHELAERHWERANALDPDNPLLLGNKSGIAYAAGRYDDAVELARRAVRLDPLNAVARSNLSTLLLAQGRFAEAEAAYRRAIELNDEFEAPGPGNIDDLRQNLASIYLLTGRHAEAMRVVEDFPDGPVKHQFLSMVLPELDRGEEARRAYQSLAAENELPAFLMRANVHAFRGETEQAFQLLQSIQSRAEVGLLTPGMQLMLDIRKSPFLIPLRSDPRWPELFVELDDLNAR